MSKMKLTFCYQPFKDHVALKHFGLDKIKKAHPKAMFMDSYSRENKCDDFVLCEALEMTSGFPLFTTELIKHTIKKNLR